MDVDTRLLRYFAAVAAEGNLTRAAERLFVSQPALTKQIKQLESQLGMRLFIRSLAGMTLTPAGPAHADRTPAVRSRSQEARLVPRLLAGHRPTPGPPSPLRIRHRPARRRADRDRQRIRHRPGPRIRRPLLRTPRHHLPAGHRRQPEPGGGRLAA